MAATSQPTPLILKLIRITDDEGFCDELLQWRWNPRWQFEAKIRNTKHIHWYIGLTNINIAEYTKTVSAGSTIKDNYSAFFSLITMLQLPFQGQAGRKTLLPQNPPVLNLLILWEHLTWFLLIHGSHALHLNLHATATLTASSDIRKLTVVIGGVWSQSSKCGENAARLYQPHW